MQAISWGIRQSTEHQDGPKTMVDGFFFFDLRDFFFRSEAKRGKRVIACRSVHHCNYSDSRAPKLIFSNIAIPGIVGRSA